MVEQEFSRRVDGQLKEQVLEIDCATVRRDLLEHELEMALKGLQITDLVAGEVGPEEMSRVCPLLSIAVEDTVAEERRKCMVPVSEAVVLELESEDSLDVLRLACCDPGLVKHPGQESIGAQTLEAGLVAGEHFTCFLVAYVFLQHVPSQDGILVVTFGTRFTSMLLDELSPVEVQLDAGKDQICE